MMNIPKNNCGYRVFPKSIWFKHEVSESNLEWSKSNRSNSNYRWEDGNWYNCYIWKNSYEIKYFEEDRPMVLKRQLFKIHERTGIVWVDHIRYPIAIQILENCPSPSSTSFLYNRFQCGKTLWKYKTFALEKLVNRWFWNAKLLFFFFTNDAFWNNPLDGRSCCHYSETSYPDVVRVTWIPRC